MSTAKYAPSRRRLHWLMVLLMVAVFVLIEFRGEFERGTAARTFMVQGHFWVGLAIFALMLPRLRNRAGPRGHVPRPDWRPQTHFETRGQKLGHGVWDLLYDRT